MDNVEIFESIMKERCREIKQLTGGKTNTTYMVDTGNNKYVLRLPGKGTNEYINRSHEIGNMQRVARLGFVPAIFYANESTGIIVSRYIENSIPMGKDDVYIHERLEEICRKFIVLHRSDVSMVNEFDIILMKKQYEKVLAEMDIKLPEELILQMPVLESAVSKLFCKYPKKLVPCHCDPKLDNFLLQNKKMYVIDWEYSGMADLYFDLVNAVMTNQFDTKEEMLFLDEYERISKEKVNKEKYILYKIATDYLWIFWHLIKFYQGDMVSYNDLSWRTRLKRALDNIKELDEL